MIPHVHLLFCFFRSSAMARLKAGAEWSSA